MSVLSVVTLLGVGCAAHRDGAPSDADGAKHPDDLVVYESTPADELEDGPRLEPETLPIDPQDAVDPMDAVDPVDSVDPIDAVDPVDPIDAVDPVDPVDSVDPREEQPPADPPVEVPAWTQALTGRPEQLALDSQGNLLVASDSDTTMLIKYGVDGARVWQTRPRSRPRRSRPRPRVKQAR